MLPDPERSARLISRCLEMYDAGRPAAPADIACGLMDLPEIPMHSPDHHVIVPLALLTAAHMRAGRGRGALCADLDKAAKRAGDIPGGLCGNYGCCGAAVGGGIFASVWNGTTPVSRTGWSAANEMTARCLAAVAGVEGPRCCKRVVCLSVNAAAQAAPELLGLDLGGARSVVCRHLSRNRECRGGACPFFPGSGQGEA